MLGTFWWRERIEGRWPAAPYVIPMLAFLALTQVESWAVQALSGRSWAYPACYGVKVLIVALLAWLCRSTWRDFQPGISVWVGVASVVVGLMVTGAWVGLDGIYPPLPLSGERVGYDPTHLNPTERGLFLLVRGFGLIVLIPLVEELFWRSFLMRWLIDPEFTRVPVARVTLWSALITAVVFALAHPEWLPALLTGLAWAGLLWWSGSLRACLVSHAVANAALLGHVLWHHAWKFW